MVKHIILWNLKDELSQSEKEESALRIKRKLEDLKGKIPGLVEIEVIIKPLSGSNAEVMLDSTFESEEALNGYQVHPEHVKAATFVRSVTCNRMCMDYIV